MCSFLFFLGLRASAITDEQLKHANRYMRRRGPDATNVWRKGSAICMHNLLHISGQAATQQPVSDAEGPVVAMFNGEIFNYKDIAAGADSDTQCLLPAYRMHGPAFARHLDGEYAITLWDAAAERFVVSTDPFMTKPLYISWGPSEVAVATYASCLESLGCAHVHMMRPNTTMVFKTALNDAGEVHVSLDQTLENFTFDLNQHKSSTLDWEAAFLDAVRKRATHGTDANRMFLTMSSGYDSGAIALALNVLGLPYDTFSAHRNENLDVLQRRIRANTGAGGAGVRAYEVSEVSEEQRCAEAAKIREAAEPFRYVHFDGPGWQLDMCDDGGARAGNYICRHMAELGYRVMLSGSGADEILSDYGIAGRKLYFHSEFGGAFPDDLAAIFPWKKFYDDTQRSYLFKDEFIAGSHGIEGRYPFLDPKVVQEWLWLRADVKNGSYKAPLRDMFERHAYPYSPDVKTGFCV